MKNYIRSTSFLAILVTATLLTGCGTSGILGGPTGTGDRTDRDGTYDPYEQRTGNVRGTIEQVDTRSRTITVNSEDSSYRSNLRNGNAQVVLSYDDRTTVEFQGRTFRPEDLERGDRILAEVASGSSYGGSYNDRVPVDQIQVLYDVSGGVGDGGGYGNGGGYDNGGYDNDAARNLPFRRHPGPHRGDRHVGARLLVRVHRADGRGPRSLRLADGGRIPGAQLSGRQPGARRRGGDRRP
jgi:hypothetical protein